MTDLLDLQGVVSRQSTWRFDVLDVNLSATGTLEVDRDAPPTLAVDVSRAVKRTLTDLRLTPGTVDAVNVIRDRLRVTMITDDGLEWPQGVFLFTDVSRLVLSAGRPLDVGALNLVDQLLIVDQQVDNAVSVGPGTVITDAVMDLMAPLPCVHEVVPSSTVVNPDAEALAWPAGTSRLRIINELAVMLGYHEFYFDNLGVGQFGPMPNPETTSTLDVLRYPVGIRTYRPSTTRSTNILALPNRFVVVNSGVTNSPVYGVYDVPDSAPHSVANRGFMVTHVEQTQGLNTSAEATAAAQALARAWRFPFETVEFDGPPDPRHDHYDTVDYEGARFLELNWKLPLREGSAMSHTLRRTYETEGV